MSSNLWYRIVGRQHGGATEILESKWGRFHEDPKAEPTSYMADSLLTAWREITARIGVVPIDPDAFRAWRVTLPEGAMLVDLRDPEERDHHQITEAELLADPPPPRCKDVARRLRQPETGYQGILYPSVRNRPQGVCAAVFLDRVEGVSVEPVEDQEWERFVRDAGI